MKTEKTRIWSRRIIVDRDAQLMLTLRVLVYMLIATIVGLAFMLYPSASRLAAGAGSLEEQSAASREFLFLDLRVVPVFLAIMLAVPIHFLFLTNRVFGPLWRLTSVLKQWREDRVWPPALRLRPRDCHGKLFAEFNGAIEAAGQDLAAVQEHLRSVAAQARALSIQVSPGETAQALAAIDTQCSSALERIERWQL